LSWESGMCGKGEGDKEGRGCEEKIRRKNRKK
jgi:hypothetical protein